MCIKSFARLVLPDKIIRTLKRKKQEQKRCMFYNIGRYSYALSPELIREGTKIGSFCSIANGVQIGPGYHPTNFLTTSPFSYYYAMPEDMNTNVRDRINDLTNESRCEIGNDVWIGTNAIIMQGIKIGDGAIIGANAVVTKDIPPYAIVAGVPAKIIRYRFDEKIISKLCEMHWWSCPDNILKKLPLENIEESISVIEKRCEHIRNSTKCCFIITSCIIPMDKPLKYSSKRTVFDHSERLEQTKKTIISIRTKCPNAQIVLVDNGIEDMGTPLREMVDSYYYLGRSYIHQMASRKNKSLGESLMMNYVLKKCNIRADIIFKISGRYYLNDAFDIANYDLQHFNFKNYAANSNAILERQKHSMETYSTRLYAFPSKELRYFQRVIKCSVGDMLRGKSIECILPKKIHKNIFYQNTLGVTGYVAVDATKIEE